MDARRLDIIRDVLGAGSVEEVAGGLRVDGRTYPVVDDVVILIAPDQYTPFLEARLSPGTDSAPAARPAAFAEDIQFSFGEEWKTYGDILPEHAAEMRSYLDLVDPAELRAARVCDLGCGAGRWSHFLAPQAREIVLVDFSDAIFVARRNLADAPNAVFFMGDIQRLPFRDDFADLVVCLGVLHHLPTPCLDEVRKLARCAPLLLVYLYYALDNRPPHYRALLHLANAARALLHGVRNERFRRAFSRAVTWGVYLPLIQLGRALAPVRLAAAVPLYDYYHAHSPRRIEQDVYDRFFTRIEQRVSRAQILTLRDTFGTVTISGGLPYWHFLCRR